MSSKGDSWNICQGRNNSARDHPAAALAKQQDLCCTAPCNRIFGWLDQHEVKCVAFCVHSVDTAVLQATLPSLGQGLPSRQAPGQRRRSDSPVGSPRTRSSVRMWVVRAICWTMMLKHAKINFQEPLAFFEIHYCVSIRC